MTAVLAQDFLRGGGTLEELKERYSLLVKRAVAHPNLVLLKYHQIDSPMSEPLVQQCRGLILDESNNWAVVTRPFDKFFNQGEGRAAHIDWNTARVLEKLDGSLIQLYYYDSAWRVATSGTPDASGEVNGSGQSFEQLFFSVFKELGYQLPSDEHHDLTFLFELMTPWNRVVVRHTANRLVLIGARDTAEGEEFWPHQFSYLGWEVVRGFPLVDWPSLEDSFASMDPLQQEGYVVVDDAFNRVKVKHPGYVALHHLKGEGFGPKRILEIIRSGESSEILTHFPEWTEPFTKIQDVFERLVVDLEADYARLSSIEGQKDFALQATKTRCSAALFQLRAGKSRSIRRFLGDMRIEGLMDILNLKNVVTEVA